MRAFVARPFGTQQDVDFERVHAELIAPALDALGITGDTTQEILRAGNIREDMFHALATADLVIADISIHNANVFYELGVRHALRARHTFVIRAKLGTKPPFDLQTDRYLGYEPTAPRDSLDALIAGIQETLRSQATDSPVMSLLQLKQGLDGSEIARLLSPPSDFREEVFRAEREGRRGDLSLLSEEAGRMAWAHEGQRLVGNAQFALAAWDAALITWEQVRRSEPADIEANARLATIHQKLCNLVESDVAVERVLADSAIKGPERAELESLRASNVKTRWCESWSGLHGKERQLAALQSPLALAAFTGYANAFADDRNHFYSGLNALAILTIIIELGARHRDAWVGSYCDSDDDPDSTWRKLGAQRAQLAAGVELALASAQRAADFRRESDRWIVISRAEHAMVAGASPAQVGAAYRRALADAPRFYSVAARRQLQLLLDLDVLPDSAAAALSVTDAILGALPSERPASNRVLLFTGHRLDKPGRTEARFPAAVEHVARGLIHAAVQAELTGGTSSVVGISGGASGGDILFHEVCAELGVLTEVSIVGSREAYITASVQDAGPSWVARFDALMERLPVRVLGNSRDGLALPRWLATAKHYSIWQRSNRWMLHNALAYGASNVTLIALWDGLGGDGPGGTRDMVDSAQARGARVVVIDARVLTQS